MQTTKPKPKTDDSPEPTSSFKKINKLIEYV